MTSTAAAPAPLARLGEAGAALDALAAVDLGSLAGDELLAFTRGFEQLVRRAAAGRHAAVAELELRHAASDVGHASTAALLADLLRLDPGEARRRARDAVDFGPRRGLTGEPLPPLRPATAAALAAGEIGIEHARAISDLFAAIPDQPPEAEPKIEAAALDAAAVCGPHRLRQWCVQAAARLDQDGHEPADERARRERGVNVIDRADGTAKLTGTLTAHTAAALRAVLGPLSAPAPAEDGSRDERTASQRRHDGLGEACTRLLRSGTLPDSGGAATTILVTIDYRDLLHRYWRCASNPGGAGRPGADDRPGGSGGSGRPGDTAGAGGTSSSAQPGGAPGASDADGSGRGGRADAPGFAVTSYGTLLPVAELLRRAGDAAIIPVVLNDAGGVMAYGRTRRLASPGQRRALAARDGGCVRPGCTVPADWCEVHHVHEWQHGGDTDIGGLALVCPRDHDDLDRGARIVMIDSVPHWIQPSYLDPGRLPRRNTAHHIPRLRRAQPGTDPPPESRSAPLSEPQPAPPTDPPPGPARDVARASAPPRAWSSYASRPRPTPRPSTHHRSARPTRAPATT